MTNKTFRRKAHAAAAPRTMRDHEARPGGVWRSGGLDDARSALALTDLKQALCSARPRLPQHYHFERWYETGVLLPRFTTGTEYYGAS